MLKYKSKHQNFLQFNIVLKIKVAWTYDSKTLLSSIVYSIKCWKIFGETSKNTYSSIFAFSCIKICTMVTIICEVLLMFFLKTTTCVHHQIENRKNRITVANRKHFLRCLGTDILLEKDWVIFCVKCHSSYLMPHGCSHHVFQIYSFGGGVHL